MGDQTRTRNITVMLLCACLALAGVIALVWGLSRPPHTASIPLPRSTTSSTAPLVGTTAPAESPSAGKQPVPAPSSSTKVVRAAISLPVKVEIPSTGEGSSLLTLGTASDRSIAVPNDQQADQAGWYDGSPTPGTNGPATIVGHSTSSRGAAVFFKLADVKDGATVNVTTKNGRVLKFTVYRVASYPKNAFPTAEVYGNTDGPELRVVTCGGTFNEASGHFENNTVLYARITA